MCCSPYDCSNGYFTSRRHNLIPHWTYNYWKMCGRSGVCTTWRKCFVLNKITVSGIHLEPTMLWQNWTLKCLVPGLGQNKTQTGWISKEQTHHITSSLLSILSTISGVVYPIISPSLEGSGSSVPPFSHYHQCQSIAHTNHSPFPISCLRAIHTETQTRSFIHKKDCAWIPHFCLEIISRHFY